MGPLERAAGGILFRIAADQESIPGTSGESRRAARSLSNRPRQNGDRFNLAIVVTLQTLSRRRRRLAFKLRRRSSCLSRTEHVVSEHTGASRAADQLHALVWPTRREVIN